MLTLTETDPARMARLGAIRQKTTQVSALLDDLFQANDDELERLAVTVEEVSSRDLAAALSTELGQPVALPDALVRVDPRRWRQVVDNVLGNAAKYARTPVEASGVIRDRHLQITLRDHGPGVPEAELDAVLARGARGSNAEGTPGLGLGLHIGDRLMQRMGGGLELRRAEPGLAVVLSLPLAG